MHKPSTRCMSRKPGKASDLAGVMNGGNKEQLSSIMMTSFHELLCLAGVLKSGCGGSTVVIILPPGISVLHLRSYARRCSSWLFRICLLHKHPRALRANLP